MPNAVPSERTSFSSFSSCSSCEDSPTDQRTLMLSTEPNALHDANFEILPECYVGYGAEIFI